MSFMMLQCNSWIPYNSHQGLLKIPNSKTNYTKILKHFNTALKVKVTLDTFPDFAYFSSYLQTKKTAWKQGDVIFSEPEMIWSLLGQFWKILIRIFKSKFENFKFKSEKALLNI